MEGQDGNRVRISRKIIVLPDGIEQLNRGKTMNKDINKTLMALVPILRMNGEKIKKIEAVKNWYKVKVDGKEYMKEVAEITYDSGYKIYASIDCDSNLTAIYDVIAVIQQIKPKSESIERIERNVYEMDETDTNGHKLSVANSIKANALINVEDIFRFLISAKDDEIIERYGSEERALKCAEKYMDIARQVDLIEYPLKGWSISYTMPIKDSDERREYEACFYNKIESEE